jgi:hypothetical protein
MIWEMGSKKLIHDRARGNIPENKIADIQFLELMEDPIRAIQKAYEHLDLDFHEGLADKITAYLAEKPRYINGRHNYNPKDYGLAAGEIRERFKFYTDYYNIAPEIG